MDLEANVDKNNILEVTKTPTADEVCDEEMEEDFPDEDQISDVIGLEQGFGTDSETVSPGEDFIIEQGYTGSIPNNVPVEYPKRYSEIEWDAEEGTLGPGVYHWDGKIVTFKQNVVRG